MISSSLNPGCALKKWNHFTDSLFQLYQQLLNTQMQLPNYSFMLTVDHVKRHITGQ